MTQQPERQEDQLEASGADESLRQKAEVEPGQTLGIDNTDTALSPEDTGYTPDNGEEEPPAAKGSDPGLDQLPA